MGEARRHLASELGCILDCDLNSGLTARGTPATDNTAVLNALLATASATNPVYLVLDGPSLTTGLLINGGHTTIEGTGPDSGLFLKSGSNSHGIRNYVPMEGDPGTGHTAPPQANFGISLRNFRINGNRGDGHTGNASNGMPYDTSGMPMLYGISLLHTTSIWLEDLTIHNATTYAICLSNCSAVVCRALRVQAPSRDRNTDGLHLNGPASDILLTDSFFQTGDDPIALNAPEGFGGPITRVAIANCLFDGCPTAMRVYGCAVPEFSFPVSSVTMTNCTGTVTNCPFLIGFQRSPSTATLQSLAASDCSFGAAHWSVINEGCGIVRLSGQTWDSPTNAGYFLWLAGPISISSITLTDCRVYRSTRGNAPTGLLSGTPSATGSTVRKLTLAGFAIESELGQAFPPIPFLIDTATLRIDELFISALDPTNITSLVNPAHGFTGIRTIGGPGVLATGFPIPDAVMADNTPYISASFPHAGSSCIKLAGKVKKL